MNSDDLQIDCVHRPYPRIWWGGRIAMEYGTQRFFFREQGRLVAAIRAIQFAWISRNWAIQ